MTFPPSLPSLPTRKKRQHISNTHKPYTLPILYPSPSPSVRQSAHGKSFNPLSLPMPVSGLRTTTPGSYARLDAAFIIVILCVNYSSPCKRNECSTNKRRFLSSARNAFKRGAKCCGCCCCRDN